jgi:general secretion pathway protein G
MNADPSLTRHCHWRGPRAAQGFTIIEIMVVVVIIGLMAAVVAPNIFGSLGKAQISKVKQDIRALEAALTTYKLDNFSFPSSSAGLSALVTRPSDETAKNWQKGGYVQRVPKDPWERDYLYANPSTHGGDYDIYSLGADGQPGGEDDNADIGNWNLEE